MRIPLFEDNPTLVVVLAVVLVLGVLGYRFYDRYRRGRGLAEWAAARGWEVIAQPFGLTAGWRGRPFRGNGRALEAVTGLVDGREAYSFLYRYTTGSGDKKETHEYHVVAHRLPARLGRLELTPDDGSAKVAKFFGAKDQDFELDEFNRAWRVDAEPPRFASDVLHPRLMERLLAPDARGQNLRIDGDTILWWREGKPRLDDIDRSLALMAEVVAAVPPFVWHDHGHVPDPATDPGRTA